MDASGFSFSFPDFGHTSDPTHFPSEAVTIRLVGTTTHYPPAGVWPADLAQSIADRSMAADLSSVSSEQRTAGTWISATGCLDATSFSVRGT